MHIWIDKAGWASRRVRRRARSFSPADIQRIAVIRHAGFGGMILTRPFLITLRRCFPHAVITLSVAGDCTRGLPRDLVDRVHIVPGSGERAALLARLGSFRVLGRQELIFDLTAGARSFWISLLNPAAFKIGFAGPGLHKFRHRLCYDVAIPRTEHRFEAETLLDQLKVLGIMPDWPLHFDLPGLEHRSRTQIVYFPGASHPRKCWPLESFAALIERVASVYPQYEHVVAGGLQPWEQERAEELVRKLAAQPVRFVPGGDAALALAARARLVVSNDNGIRNYAIAAGTPTVGIFFATLPFTYLPRFGMHRAAFDAEGSLPSVEQVGALVLQACAELSAEIGQDLAGEHISPPQ